MGNIWEIDCQTMSWLKRPSSRRSVLLGAGGTVLGATLLGSLAGCGDKTATTATSGAGGGGQPGAGKTIALSLNGFNTYNQDMAEGCLKALDGTAYKFIGAEAGFDVKQEVDNINQLVARQPDGLIILAASAEGAARAASQAARADIPVVTSTWFPVSPEVDSVYYAATQLNDEEAGKLTVDFIANEMGVTEGKILEVTGLDAQPFTEGFKQGLRNALKSQPGLEVAASQQGFYTAAGALKALRPMLTAHPDAKVVIDYASEMGVAIAQEFQRRKITDVIHITGDINDRLYEWLKKDDGAYLKGTRWFSGGSEGIVCTTILRNKLEKDEDPADGNLGMEGYVVEPGTKGPVVVKCRQELATGRNVDELPPPGYPEYAGDIPFGG